MTSNFHSGNIRFRELVTKYQSKYDSARKEDKKFIAYQIVLKIKETDPPGRFLQQEEYSEEEWVELTEAKAVKKVIQRLKDQAPGTNGLRTKGPLTPSLPAESFSTTTNTNNVFFTPCPNDILFGKFRSEYNNHLGNKRMRDIIQTIENVVTPENAPKDLCDTIIQRILDVDGGCRFLKEKNDAWVEATEDDVYFSIRSCLKNAREQDEEVAAILLQQIVEEQKQPEEVSSPLQDNNMPSSSTSGVSRMMVEQNQKRPFPGAAFQRSQQQMFLQQRQAMLSGYRRAYGMPGHSGGLGMPDRSGAFGASLQGSQSQESLLLERCWQNMAPGMMAEAADNASFMATTWQPSNTTGANTSGLGFSQFQMPAPLQAPAAPVLSWNSNTKGNNNANSLQLTASQIRPKTPPVVRTTLENDDNTKDDNANTTMDNHNMTWEDRFLDLLEYLDQNGDLEAPPSTPLGMWMNVQRKQYAFKTRGIKSTKQSGLLTPLQEAKLDAIGFDWYSEVYMAAPPAELLLEERGIVYCTGVAK